MDRFIIASEDERCGGSEKLTDFSGYPRLCPGCPDCRKFSRVGPPCPECGYICVCDESVD